MTTMFAQSVVSSLKTRLNCGSMQRLTYKRHISAWSVALASPQPPILLTTIRMYILMMGAACAKLAARLVTSDITIGLVSEDNLDRNHLLAIKQFIIWHLPLRVFEVSQYVHHNVSNTVLYTVNPSKPY